MLHDFVFYRDTVKASVILLPLLGLTWVFGLFVVSQNTVVFAWIFAILNTLQGVFVFIFHVLRSEKVPIEITCTALLSVFSTTSDIFYLSTPFYARYPTSLGEC